MKKTWAVAVKELQNFFFNPTGYIFAGLLLTVVNWLFWNDVFLMGTADVKPLLQTIAYLFSLFVPVLVMGAVADEKKNGNYEVLKSLPLSADNIIFGKFLALAIYLLAVSGLSLIAIASIRILGNVDWGAAASGYLGLILLGLAYGAIAIFMSTVSRQAIVSFLITSVILILNNMMSQDVVLSRLPAAIQPTVQSLSLAYRFGRFGDGVVNLGDSVFMVSVIAGFLVSGINLLKRGGDS